MKFNLKKSALPCFLSFMLTIGGSVNIQASQNSLLQQENDLQKQYAILLEREQKENALPGTYTKDVVKKLRQIDKIKWDEIDKKCKANKKLQSSNYLKLPGLILVTKDDWTSGSSGSCPFMGHAAIMKNDEKIIEANPKDGVTNKRDNNWEFSRTTCYVAYARDAIDNKGRAADWCESQCGKPYSFHLNIFDKSKFYCSQLVWAGYYEATGVDLRNLGVFQGIIAPNDLLNDKFVDIIYRQ